MKNSPSPRFNMARHSGRDYNVPTEPSTTLAAKNMGKVTEESQVVLTWDGIEKITDEGDEETLKIIQQRDDVEMSEVSDVEDNEEGDTEVFTQGKEGGFGKENEIDTKKRDKEGTEGGNTREPEGDAEGVMKKANKGDSNQKNDKGKTERNSERKDTDGGDEGDAEGDEEDDKNNTEQTSNVLKTRKTKLEEDEGGRRKIRTSTEGDDEGGRAGVKAYLVVGTQKGWEAGRVEEVQLRDSAALFNYDYKVS